jgi:DNA-binding NarL/FixJ family response regulator
VLAAIDRHRPDVILLDLRMPRVDGLEAMALVRTQPSPPRILVLTTFDTDDHVLRALRSAGGESMLSPTVTRRLIDRLAGEADAETHRRSSMARLASLSERDRQIAHEIAAGKPNAAIALELHLSVATVKSHVSAMLAQLSLDNRVQIALMVQDAERS